MRFKTKLIYQHFKAKCPVNRPIARFLLYKKRITETRNPNLLALFIPENPWNKNFIF